MSSLTLVVIAGLAFQAPSPPFVSKEGGFTLGMPGTPEESRQEQPAPMGRVSSHFYQAIRGDLIYVASYSDYPPQPARDEPEKVLEGAVRAAVAGADGAKLLRKANIALGRLPGREFEFSFPVPSGGSFLGRGRLYLVDARMYSMMVLGPKDQVERTSPGYFASFALMKAPPPPMPGAARATSPPATTVRLDAGVTPAAGAKVEPFVSNDHGFRVAFPARPQERKLSQPSRLGPMDTFVFAAQSPRDGLVYVVTATKYPAPVPPGDVANLLAGFIKSSVANAGGPAPSQGDIRLGTSPGKEFAFERRGADGAVIYNRTRAYFANNSFYALTVKGPKDRVMSPAGTAFLDSFALVAP